jgi:hypothetical protein
VNHAEPGSRGAKVDHFYKRAEEKKLLHPKLSQANNISTETSWVNM